jgi:hypothetical protein
MFSKNIPLDSPCRDASGGIVFIFEFDRIRCSSPKHISLKDLQDILDCCKSFNSNTDLFKMKRSIHLAFNLTLGTASMAKKALLTECFSAKSIHLSTTTDTLYHFDHSVAHSDLEKIYNKVLLLQVSLILI